MVTSKQPSQQPRCEDSQKPETIIDWNGCVRMCQGNSELAKQILTGLEEQIKKCQTTFAQAYDSKNTIALRAELHKCIGGVCYMRFPPLERALNDLQTATHIEPQNPQQLETTYRALQKAIEAFLQACARGNFF